jgi:dTMP kinase
MIPRDPDKTILIDMDPSVGLSRAKSRNGVEERFEDFGVALQEKMRQGFLDLADEFSSRFAVINGLQELDDVQRDVRKVVLSLIK